MNDHRVESVSRLPRYGRVAQRGDCLSPLSLHKNSLAVRQIVERVSPVVRPCPAVTHSAERERNAAPLDDRVVSDEAPGARPVAENLGDLLVLAEDVQREALKLYGTTG